MMDRRSFIKCAGAAVCSVGAAGLFARPANAKGAGKKPNFVLIFIDDMGYGDIEPFGSVLNKTPHLNRMAAEGMKLTSFYSAAPVCTPSRAALMTGCYPKRVGLATGSWGVVLFPKDAHGLNPKEKTIASILKDAGYATGCFGKWHLGDQPEFMPTSHGFDTYVGIPYSNDMWPPHPSSVRWKSKPCPLPLMRDTKVADIVENMTEQGGLCKLFTDEATSFIKKNKDKPFFVYLPHAFVHHPRYARKEFLDKAGSEQLTDEKKLAGQPKYGMRQRTRAQIEEVDWSVGRILSTLRELGLEKDTVVIFTSDNGGASGCCNSPLRGGKGSTWEGGMREPALAWRPGTIPAGASCDEIATTMDILPTFAAIAGAKTPADRKIDGKNITPLLLGQANVKSQYEAFFYYHRTNLQAVRCGQWKLRTNGQLHNLKKDIGEKQNVAKQNPDVVARLTKLLDACRADLDNPKNCRPVGKVTSPKYLTPFKQRS
jgi:arylsulfatase A